MKFTGNIVVLFFFLLAVSPAETAAQQIIDTAKGLFDTDEPLNITLSGQINELLRDRADIPKLHPVMITYKGRDSNPISVPVEARTRGHFRKLAENCNFPPLLLQFRKSGSLEASIFRGQEKLKLVMPCQGDNYIVREWLVYKIYNLLTPASFRARLVKLNFNDPKSKKEAAPFYGFLIEEERQVAARNNLIIIRKPRRPEQTRENTFLVMAAFEYLIGNTDWSVQYLQNINLLAADSNSVPITVPYDFDHAGLVDASYAKPAEELEIPSIRYRRYRGYCIKDMKQFDSVVVVFNQYKKDIYKIYSDCPLLDEKYKKSTLKFLDDFYYTINNPKELQKEFSYPCDPNGTGNVIIRGLK